MTALDAARTVADAVLYEGYLLYPYRASSDKNRMRWQFGILGPTDAPSGLGEPPELQAEFLLEGPDGAVGVHLRFLQLQTRQVYDLDGRPVPQLTVGGRTLLTWEEAVAREVSLGVLTVADLHVGRALPVQVAGGEDLEVVHDAEGQVAGRLVRRRVPMHAEVSLSATDDDPVIRVRLGVRNVTELPPGASTDRDGVIARSLLGAHVLVHAVGTRFVSLLEPPPHAVAAAGRCTNVRCWPVLAAADDDLLLVSPIILYDHPEVAPESVGPLFDATEIDEILTLRVMTLTDEEKAEARATDPHAAAIIDRCDQMSEDDLLRLHGALRDPSSVDPGPDFAHDSWDMGAVPSWADAGGRPWWDPAVDGSVSPETDTVVVQGVAVSRGSRVRVRPRRRADAQDIFFTDREATIAAVYIDVDGNLHVAVVLTDDPAADLHEWYGRYLYFGPDELEPVHTAPVHGGVTTEPEGR